MTKTEIQYLLKNGFSLAEILALEAGDQPEPAEETPAAPPAEDPAGEAKAPEAEPDTETPPAAPGLAEEVKALRAVVEKLQSAALNALRQPGGESEKSLEDIVAEM